MLEDSRRRRRGLNIWPGYVDALATLLLLFVFVLSLFMVAQYFLSDALSGREAALERLEADIDALTEIIAMEREERAATETQLAELETRLVATLAQRDEARARVSTLESQRAALEDSLADQEETLAEAETRRGELESRLAGLEAREGELEAERSELRDALTDREEDLERERALTDDQAARIDRLHLQIIALREQLSALSEALDLSEATAAAQRAEIRDLGERLNLALAERVQELSQYRSEFFGRLREVLGDHPDIRIEGDRFLFQSELLFDTASADLGDEGREQLAGLATTLDELRQRIPEDLDWVLQVEGHTDRRPIRTAEFPSNWELSSARAQTIVRYLMDQGIPPERLAAAGFAEYQPVDDRDTPEAWARNRRIELRLTNR
ncbi:chemotaxis protein MotB [Alkalispirillum mobile]|uniref:Chemotaxis protein MotB n=1 Tax=Alkalispirillum mobile TaxID=85925 RepID=A0A498BTF2_9GAMM|nr:peptidoglycan -binding protein [Alkalispirillum mobile]RLK46965.1 chemotaxis protein MotB [Alkalispirillum mobile]